VALFSIQAIKDANAKIGQHYFSPDTMRFFKSRVMQDVFPLEDGALFVTSERREGDVRRYTIRRAWDDGDITTLDGFQSYTSRNGALKAAKKAAANIKSASLNNPR